MRVKSSALVILDRGAPVFCRGVPALAKPCTRMPHFTCAAAQGGGAVIIPVSQMRKEGLE